MTTSRDHGGGVPTCATIRQRSRSSSAGGSFAASPVSHAARSTDRFALLDLPIEQLCGQIAGRRRPAARRAVRRHLETRGARREPATVKEVITALAAGGDKDIDDYLTLAGKMVPATNAAQESDDAGAGEWRRGSGLSSLSICPADAAAPTPRRPVRRGTGKPRNTSRLRASISHGSSATSTDCRSPPPSGGGGCAQPAFTVCGVLGLSVFNGRITYTVMCAIVGGFVATASRDLDRGRREGAPADAWGRQFAALSQRRHRGARWRHTHARRIVLLVHGYNNDKADADRATRRCWPTSPRTSGRRRRTSEVLLAQLCRAPDGTDRGRSDVGLVGTRGGRD